LDNSFLLNTRTGDKWQRIGTNKRAGIAVPLFSVYSSASCGIGDFNDLKLLVDWCSDCGFTILQLLPLNDVGSDFAPYSSVSTFAIDPMYISFNLLTGSDSSLNDEIINIRKKYRHRFGKVYYGIKKAKIELTKKIFTSADDLNNKQFQNFIYKNIYCLKDYAVFKILKQINNDLPWENFSDDNKYHDANVLSKLEIEYENELKFIYWLQWKLFEQLKQVKEYASSKGIFIMGDLPFLVSRDSADVWAHQNYFRLDLSSGAPPDMYFALGQKWGMPPYNWESIACDDFNYVRDRLIYAENFYHMYRIDHFVGLFRVWTSNYEINTPVSIGGSFLPNEEYLWEEHGRRIIDIMNSTSMLACAEDLGTVPECSYRVLSEYGIPGIDFQRYMKSNYFFRSPAEYRINSCTVVSTHDSAFFINWWQFEAGTIDEKLFEIMFFSQSDNKEHYSYVINTLFDLNNSAYGRLLWNENISSVEIMLGILQPRQDKVYEFANLYMESFAEKNKFMSFLGVENVKSEGLCYFAIKKSNETNSIFNIQLLQEYLCLESSLLEKIGKWKNRINTPGKVSKDNWSIRLPISLENLLNSELNNKIRNLLRETGRSFVQ